ncbi:hypothetical protein [Spiroplasma alleghenense]|uniref:Lipoprotein n=1 Tax=Spiroplasma alleghenense TaxID=216931 RepID=A0A345Z554_9MOLU|nr:hypothetical protein [Spiroplasma alleghenense]AXK51733.1 hypothetical protein SALLE_v1c10630 [Spiroplasma alleghenense]
MRKLLSIFAASAMAISSPLAVVACKKNSNENAEFDFEAQRNKFVSTVTQIFQTQFKSFFEPLRFVSQEESPFDKKMTTVFLRENANEISQGQGLIYDFVKSEITKVIHWSDVLEQINEEIMKNVNFRSMLIDGKNPLSEGFLTNTLELTDGDNEIATINVGFSSQIVLLNNNKDKEYVTIKYETQINLISGIEIAEEFNRINEDYLNLFKNEKQANEFKIESNKGDYKTAGDIIISEKGEIMTTVKNLIKNIELSNNHYSIDVDSTLMSYDENYLAIGSTVFNSVKYAWGSTPAMIPEVAEFGQNVMSAFGGNRKAKEAVVKTLSENEENPVVSRNESEEIKNQVSEFDNMSVAINVFGVEENLQDNRLFTNKIRKEQPNFAINYEEDQKLISLFGIEIQNSKIRYKEEIYELSKPFLLVRQNTEDTGTQALYTRFLSDALDYQIKFAGFSSDSSQSVNSNSLFYFNKPDSLKLDSLYNFVLGYKYFNDDFWDAASIQTKAYQEDLEFTSQFCGASLGNLKPASYLYFDKNERLYFSNRIFTPNDNVFKAQIVTSFFSFQMDWKLTASLALGNKAGTPGIVSDSASHFVFKK